MSPSAPSLEQLQAPKLPIPEHKPHKQVLVEEANCGQLGAKQKERLDHLLHHFITGGLFPTDPKLVLACVDGEPSPFLIDGSCAPDAEKQRHFSPQVFTTRKKIYG